jgi:hypothetical protein
VGAQDPPAGDVPSSDAPSSQAGELEDAKPPPPGQVESSSFASVFKFELTASAWIASVDGSLQTSKGGNAGTTSNERPTVEEIGLDGLNALPLVDARLVFFENHELHIGFAHIDLSGHDTLQTSLVSQGESFPAGSDVSSTLNLDLLRFDYRPLWLQPRIGSWTLVPEIGLAWNPFQYTLHSPAATGSVDRSYAIAFPYIGIFLEGPVFRSLRAEVDLAGSAGINGATFVDTDVRLVHPVASWGSFQVEIVAGLKGTWMRRRDNRRSTMTSTSGWAPSRTTPGRD